RVDAVERAVTVDRWKVKSLATRPRRAVLFARVLAAQKTAGQRAPHHEAHLLVGEDREQFAFEIAPGNRVIRLKRFETAPVVRSGQAVCLGDVPRGEVR